MEPTQEQQQRQAYIKWGILGAIAFILLVTFFSSLRMIGTGQIGVVTRYGKVTGRELKEGAHFVLPWGVDNVTKYDIQVQKEDAEAAAASKDLQDVNAKLVLNYRIEAGQVSHIHQTIGAKYHDKLIAPALQEVFKATSAKFDATQLITNRAEVKAEAAAGLRERLEKYGIVITDVSLTNFQFSADFSKAIEAKQVAQQEAQRAVFVAEKAKQEAQADIERARGQAESQRLLQSTASAQTIQLKTLEVQMAAIAKWNGALPTTSLSSDSNFLLNLQGGR